MEDIGIDFFELAKSITRVYIAGLKASQTTHKEPKGENHVLLPHTSNVSDGRGGDGARQDGMHD